MRKWLHRVQWANIVVGGLTLVNQYVNAVPALQQSPTGLAIQMGVQFILGSVLPSVGGISHKLDGTMVVPK